MVFKFCKYIIFKFIDFFFLVAFNNFIFKIKKLILNNNMFGYIYLYKTIHEQFTVFLDFNSYVKK